MKSTELLPYLAAFLSLHLTSARAGTVNSSHLPSEEFRWISGPTTVSLRDVARLRIPEGLAFLNAPQSKALLERLGNRTSGNEVGLVVSESQDWSVVVEFHPVGYVSQEGWELIDSSAILKAIRAADQRANPERERNGWPAVEVKDWESAPSYDPAAHSMEWAVHAVSGGTSVINRVISVLSRRGVAQFILVNQNPSSASTIMLRQLVQGLAFEPGERYVDRQPGDPTTTAGLTGLLATLEAPATLEVARASDAESHRTALPGGYWWLVPGAAGLAGFFAGRRRRRHRRDGRDLRVARAPRTSDPRSRARQSTSIPATLPLEHHESVVSANTSKPVSPPGSSDPPRFRHRRCDAYSFYARLTRDLHWTIKY